METSKFCVQNADFFYLPINHGQIDDANKTFIDLFMDVDPMDRCDWFDELNNAIEHHEISFS